MKVSVRLVSRASQCMRSGNAALIQHRGLTTSSLSHGDSSPQEKPKLKTLADIPTPSGFAETAKMIKMQSSFTDVKTRGKFVYNLFSDLWHNHGDVVKVSTLFKIIILIPYCAKLVALCYLPLAWSVLPGVDYGLSRAMHCQIQPATRQACRLDIFLAIKGS